MASGVGGFVKVASVASAPLRATSIQFVDTGSAEVRQHKALGGLVAQGIGEIEQQLEGSSKKTHHCQLPAGCVRLTGQLVVAGEPSGPYQPAIAPLVRYPEAVGRDQRLIPRADGRRRIRSATVQFGVALPKERKGVLVGTQPDMQAVLFDPAVIAPATMRPFRLGATPAGTR